MSLGFSLSASLHRDKPTIPSDAAPRAKIDYVLYRPANKWRVLETKVICNEKATDHCVMLSILEL